MHVKGFIMEDDRGQEFVMLCQPPSERSGRIFSLRGWQRRRLIPLHHTERDSQEIMAGVLHTLHLLFTSPPQFTAETDDSFLPPRTYMTSQKRLPKPVR